MVKTREELETQNLEELFERFRQSPEGYAFVPLSDACRKMGRIDEALEICDAGVRRHPAYPSGHVVRGKCLYDKGNRTGAREAFERVLLLDEHNLVALKYLGMIEADDGNLSAAEKHLKRILSFDPENKEIRSILRLVEEQGQIERSVDEPAATMEALDEILDDVAATPEADDDDPDEPAQALSIEADIVAESPGAPSLGARLDDDVETSDELASVTLADIFAEQGYTSKAAKIYREVLRRQPANDAIRARLEELTGESVREEAPGQGPVPGEPEALCEIEPLAPPADGAPEAPAECERRDESAAVSSPATLGDKAPDAEVLDAVQPEADPEAAASVSASLRPEITEKDSLNHFRHWLTKLRG